MDKKKIVQWQLIVQLLLVAAAFGGGPVDPRCPQEHKPDTAIFFSHSTDCTKFYMCLFDRSVLEKDCQEGHQFDQEQLVRIYRL